MDRELHAFLMRCTPVASEGVEWGERMRLRATAYLSQDLLPLPYVTSVRAIVHCGESVLVQQDRDSRHILPGGRREGDESLDATLRRELAEEIGWSVDKVEQLGFTHFWHLDPKQPDYPYPHPDFFQLVHVAKATRHSPHTRLDDGYEIGSEFVLLTDVHRLSLTPIERVYLDAALRIRGSLT